MLETVVGSDCDDGSESEIDSPTYPGKLKVAREASGFILVLL